MSNKRNITFDILRALCVIEIVCFWHIIDYLPITRTPIEQILGSKITMGCLSCFTFMSSYFLQKYSIYKLKDAFAFYKKRITRFFILLFLSATSLYVAGVVVGQPFFSTIQYLGLLTGTSIFFEPYPPTLWYFGMIIMFYLLTPLVLFFKSKHKRLIVSFIILLSFYGIEAIGVKIDSRLFIYMPVYLIGLITPMKFPEYCTSHLVGIISFFLWTLSLLYEPLQPFVYDLCQAMLFIAFMTNFSHILSSTSCSRLLCDVSYSSMVAYLFHRHFYLVFVFLFNVGTGVSLREGNIPFSFMYLLIPIIFTVSYYIQKIYDYLSNKYLIKPC